MKKIIGAAAAGLVLTGAAFADITFTGNARVGADLFKYTSPSRSTRPNNGDVVWMDDTKHADSVTLKGTSDNSGFNIKMTMTSPIDGSKGSAIQAEEYQLWTTLFGLRLDAGAYESRFGKALNNDGKWSTNLSGKYKPGIWTNIDGAAWGSDSMNITTLKASKSHLTFKVTKDVSDQLKVAGSVFVTDSGTNANAASDASSNDNWIFTPFALGATYSLDKNTQLNFAAKLNSITKGKYTEKETAGSVNYETVFVTDASKNYKSDGTFDAKAPKKGTYYTQADGTVVPDSNTKFDVGTQLTKITVKDGSTTSTYTPDNSVYTLGVDFYKKMDSGMEIEAVYTFGMSLYSNWSGIAAHNGDNLVRDYDVFAHGLDFRTKTKLTNELSLTGIASVNYVQGREVDRRDNRGKHVEDGYKDARAKSYATGAAGTLGYYASVSLDYVMTDTINFQLQSHLIDTNAFSTVKVDGKTHVDYFDGMQWNLRPAVILKPDAKTMVKAGVHFLFDGFHQNATGKANTFKTTVSVPLTFNISL